jgi:hypothetical protein
VYTHRTCTIAALALLALSACRGARTGPPALTRPTPEAPARLGLLDARAALAAVCPPEHLEADACAVCPFGDDSVGPMRYAGARPGRYDDDEAGPSYLVMFEGCTVDPEYADEHFTPSNSYVLATLSEVDGALELTSYHEFIDLSACVFPRTRDAREAIVCVETFQEHEQTTTYVTQLDPEDIAVTDELAILNSDVEHCRPMGGYYTNHVFYGMALSDEDGDGVHEVVIEATFDEGELPDTYDTYCDALEAGHDFGPPTERFHWYRQDETGHFYPEEQLD